ncbi:MAG: Ger(x)C family spore germination protein [Bacillota bacterium]
MNKQAGEGVPMKRLLFIPLVSLLVFILPGCWDREDLEDVAFVLVTGLDLDQDNNLLIYDMVPVYHKEAKEKEIPVKVRSLSLRESRGKIDDMFEGVASGRKLQIFLLGKRLLKHEDWFPLLDVLFRDTKNAVTADVVFVNGPVSQVIFSRFPEVPHLSIHLYEMIKSASKRHETVITTLHELHRQMYEKGITPAISDLELNEKLELKGTALLNEKGKYVNTLRIQENVLLMILQKQVKKELPLTLKLPQMKKGGGGIFDTNVISFTLVDMKTKIKTAYRDGRFQFDIRIRSYIDLSEREFPFDVKNKSGELEKMIEKQLNQQFENLIKKIQKHKIDPIGLGLYARAHEYKEWQKVQDDWGEALSKADIKINVKVKVKSMGPVK